MQDEKGYFGDTQVKIQCPVKMVYCNCFRHDNKIIFDLTEKIRLLNRHSL